MESHRNLSAHGSHALPLRHGQVVLAAVTANGLELRHAHLRADREAAGSRRVGVVWLGHMPQRAPWGQCPVSLGSEHLEVLEAAFRDGCPLFPPFRGSF